MITIDPEIVLDLFKYGCYTISAYYLYLLFFVPMNRIRKVSDVGYKHLDTEGRATTIKRLQKNRRMGKCPPPFPNGWFVVAESRDVRIFLKIRHGPLSRKVRGRNEQFYCRRFYYDD